MSTVKYNCPKCNYFICRIGVHVNILFDPIQFRHIPDLCYTLTVLRNATSATPNPIQLVDVVADCPSCNLQHYLHTGLDTTSIEYQAFELRYEYNQRVLGNYSTVQTDPPSIAEIPLEEIKAKPKGQRTSEDWQRIADSY